MFYGKVSSFQDYVQHVRLWVRTAKAGPASRTSTLVLRVNSVPRQIDYRRAETMWMTRTESRVYWKSSEVTSPRELRTRPLNKWRIKSSIVARISRQMNSLRNSTRRDGRRNQRWK